MKKFSFCFICYEPSRQFLYTLLPLQDACYLLTDITINLLQHISHEEQRWRTKELAQWLRARTILSKDPFLIQMQHFTTVYDSSIRKSRMYKFRQNIHIPKTK